jgi:hypothetical protein
MMAGFLTDYSNNKVLDLFFGSSIFTPPPTLYLGLSMTSANKGGSYIEPSGGGYARVAVANNSTNFPTSSGGTKANAAVITFPAPTADWGAVQSLFITDAPTGGNVLASADLTVPKTVTGGSTAPKVAVGALFLSHS